jgi:flagellar biosynthetic protein FliR
MDIAAWSTCQFKFFILVLFRVMGLFMVAPFFGSNVIPAKVKILFGVLIAAIVFPYVPDAGVALPASLGGLACAVVGEMAIGFIIGFAATIMMTAIQVGGHWVGQQVGLTLANVIDPVSNNRISIIEQFKYIFAVLIFLGLNGHHYLLKALVETFKIVPVRGFALRPDTCRFIADSMMSEMFVFAVKVAAPFIVALLIVTVAMGFIAKTVPEVNIFIIGFGVRIVIGIGLLFLALPVLAVVFENLFVKMMADVDIIVNKLLG